jgi:uncharacterized protein (TIGR03437 family)
LDTLTTRQFLCPGFAGLLVLFLVPALPAANVTWDVTGTFTDGGTIIGSFTVDADTQTISTWSVGVAGGDTTDFPQITYTPSNSFFSYFATQDTYQFTVNASNRDFRIGPFNTPLTDAGGAVTTVANVFGNVECINCAPYRNFTANLSSIPADLTVASMHTGIFLRGQTGATYTITVNNIEAGGPSIGTVTAIDTLPAGMTATSIAGTGWTCGLATVTCQRSDTLAGSASYPPITITLNVGPGAAAASVNSVTVSGGGETNTSNDTGTDPTQVNDPPDLTISKSHGASFTRGQSGAYTLVVSNVGAGVTFSAVNAIDAIPSGLAITAMAGTGWACNPAMGTCSRSDVLGAGGSYPPIAVTVSVAPTCPLNVTNSASVSGGGELNTANDSASDPTAINAALTILTPLPKAISGNQYSQALSATGGVTPYVWSASGLPSWLSLSASGVLAGSPAANFYGSVPFTASVTDGIGDVTSASVQLTVQLPVLLILQYSFTDTAGSPFFGALGAIGGLKPYTWSAAGMPPWLSINSMGQITGTPPLYGSAGSYTLPVVVTDVAGNTASLGVPLIVNPAPITITPQSLSPAVVGVAYQVTFAANGGSGKYTWSASTVPSGFSLSPSGVFTGTAAQGSTGTYTFSVTATDSNNASASANLNLQVNPSPVVITTLSNLPAATETLPYTTTLAAEGGVPPYRWSATGLPSWLSLRPDGSLSGTPPVGTAGMVTFNASVNDSSMQTAQATFQITVSPADSILAIDTAIDLPPATLGVPYNESLSAQGGTPPYNWTEAPVAPGLSLSSSGVISGTPTAETAATFTGQVNDMAGNSAFQQFNLNIVSPGISIQNAPTLAIGQVGVPYMQLLSASGGGQPLTWSLAQGALPQGITLTGDGVLQGTPVQTGNFSFSVSVNNSSAPAVQTAHFHPHAASQTFQIAVQPSSANLIFSAGTLSFSSVSGGSAPASQSISIITTSAAPLLFNVTAGSPWVQVSPSNGSTPANVVVSVDPTNLAPGTYSTNIGFSTPGKPPETVALTLSVSLGSPALSASPNSIQIANSSGSSTPLTGPIIVQNTGSGYLSFTATVLDAPWLSLDQGSGVLSPNQSDTLTFTASTNALAPGVYRGRIELGSNSGFAEIPVTLTVTAQYRLLLSSAGTLLQARQGAGISGPPTQSFSILASGDSALNWTAQVAGSSSFLTLLTASGVSTATVPGTVSYQVDPTGLDVGSYYGRIEIASGDAANSPQEFVVVLNVVSSAIPASPNPSPAGVLFVSSANGAPAQQVTVFTSSATSVGFQASASTDTGSPWLSVTPLSGQISSQSPAQLTVNVSPSGLGPGVYRGTVNVAEGSLAVSGVNVTLIVPGSAPQLGTGVTQPSATPAPRAAGGCSADSLVLTYTLLTNQFSTPAAWPGTIGVTLADNCGAAVDNGNILATFSNGDPALSLNLSDPATGFYSSTWVPRSSGSQVTISAQATAAGLQPALATLIGTVAPNLAPVIATNGILHDLNPQVGAALAPGTIVQIFGSQLAGVTAASNQPPLPTTLQGTSVLIGGIPAPLFYISPTQVNAQIPFELVPGHAYPVIVIAGNSLTVPESIQLAPLAPGVARLPDGSVIAQHADFSLVTEAAPAKPGEYLVAYLAGLGLTDVPVPDGAASPSNPLATVSVAPAVTLNGEPVIVAFAGLTPGLVGLYQINFQVPTDASAGDLVLQVTQQDVAADAGTIAVAK